MSRPSRLALIAILGFTCLAVGCKGCFDSGSAPTPVTIPINAKVYVKPPSSISTTPPPPLMTEDEFIKLLSGGNTILNEKTLGSTTDTACPVTLSQGSFGTFSNGNGVIASWWDFEAAFLGNGATGTLFPTPPEPPEPTTDGPTLAVREVRVVKEISWCNTESTLIGGCQIGHRIVVTPHATLDSILWAHEIGHSRTLLHRYDSWVAIMHPDILNDHFELSQSECKTYAR